MVRNLTIAIVLTALMTGLAYAGAAPQTGINGSSHDMNTWSGWGATKDVYGRTCVFCHTPHNAVTGQDYVANAPLWNRNDTPMEGTAYSWVTPANLVKTVNGVPEAAIPIVDPLVGPTRLCMSCHDGTTAPDSHLSAGTQPGTMTPYVLGDRGFVGDLQITHPIGFKYSDAMASRGAGELVDATTGYLDVPPNGLSATTFDTKSRAGLNKSSVTIADTLFNNADGAYMTCATCHEVHNTKNVTPEAGHTYNYFLRAKEEGSAICLSCHIK